jgi:2-polyprenyl-6-methoxyphenol hydroxylase-like FAD-dependent oxidoreductase
MLANQLGRTRQIDAAYVAGCDGGRSAVREMNGIGNGSHLFDDLIPALQRERSTSLTFTSCHWFSTYRIHHRCTERFRDRRRNARALADASITPPSYYAMRPDGHIGIAGGRFEENALDFLSPTVVT